MALALARVGVTPDALRAQPTPDEPAWSSPDAMPSKKDWIQIKSHEWLRGDLIALYEDELLFDSDDFGPRNFKWKDIREVRTGRELSVGLIDGEILVGKLWIVGENVRVIHEGKTQREFARAQILSIAPGGSLRGRLGGKVAAGFTVRKGNVDQVDANVSAEIEHRRVRDRIELDYLANYYRNEGVETSNDQRVNSNWTHFVTDRFFVVPAAAEWYRDPIQNLDSRSTVGGGLGYQIVDTRRTEWQVSSGLAYQRTKWVGVEVGEDETESAAAFLGSTSFEQEITKSIDLELKYTFYLTQEGAGRYIHHAQLTVETDVTDVLDFDVSLYWDHTRLPQARPDGTVPEQDDVRMVIALGLEF